MTAPRKAPKRAPKEVPPEAARYLDEAAARLSELVDEHGLKLKPYDQYHPDHTAWTHGIYGESRSRDICIQVVTDEDMATTFTAVLKAYLRLYPSDGSNAWLLLGKRRVRDMVGLVTGVTDLTLALQLACVWRMPHPTEPDPKC